MVETLATIKYDVGEFLLGIAEERCDVFFKIGGVVVGQNRQLILNEDQVRDSVDQVVPALLTDNHLVVRDLQKLYLIFRVVIRKHLVCPVVRIPFIQQFHLLVL